MLYLLLVSAVFLQYSAAYTYDELLALNGLSPRQDRFSASDIYRRRLGVANRGHPWYGDLVAGTQTRDHEYEPQNRPLYGYKYISGGAGEGKQHLSPSGVIKNKEEVKTDKVLPAYCNPPNPCPFGHIGNDCLQVFENTAAYNRKYNNEQDCSCDSEHMLKCPEDKKTVSAMVHGGDDKSAASYGQVLSQLINVIGSNDGYLMGDSSEKGSDHMTISKKAMLRKKRMAEMPEVFNNPNMYKHRLTRVAKKSPNNGIHSPVFI